MSGGPYGPRECSREDHPHVLMCPVQAAQVAGLAVMSGMARRDDGIGLAWWTLGLAELRYGDATAAMQDLVAGGIGERKWITARDVIRRVRAIRGARHAQAPEPVPPGDLSFRQEQAFRRWYWVAVGNGETAGKALELAAGTVGLDRYIEPAAPTTSEDIEPGSVQRVREVLKEARSRAGLDG